MCSLSATEKLCSVLSRSDELKVQSWAFIVIIINTHNFSKNKWIKFKVSIYGYCGSMKSPIAFRVNPMNLKLKVELSLFFLIIYYNFALNERIKFKVGMCIHSRPQKSFLAFLVDPMNLKLKVELSLLTM